jgi:HEPN domain-containing protein
MRSEALDEGKRCPEQAGEDLRWAADLAERGGYHIACFLAQQVAGKAVKAFLYAQGEEVVIGHSNERLCRQAALYEPECDKRVKRWAILDGNYIPTRYPNSLPDSIPARVYTHDAAEGSVRMAAEAVAYVRSRIGSE